MAGRLEGAMKLLQSQEEGNPDEMITKTCILSTESGLPKLRQGIEPNHFCPDTGIYRGDPVTPEQLAFLENIAGNLPE